MLDCYIRHIPRPHPINEKQSPNLFPCSEWTASKILIKPDYIETDRWFPVDSWMDGSSKLPGSVAQQAAAAATTNTVNTTNTQLQIQMHKYKHHKHTNTQVHKYALDSIVTHICSLLIGFLHSLVSCRKPNTFNLHT